MPCPYQRRIVSNAWLYTWIWKAICKYILIRNRPFVVYHSSTSYYKKLSKKLNALQAIYMAMM